MNITISSEKIQALIERDYGLRVRRPLGDMPQGVHSKVWLATTDDGRWVAKVSNPDCDPVAKVVAQSELYDFLNQHGLHTPVLRANQHGEVIGEVEHAGQLYPFTLMRYHELRRMAPETIAADELRRISATIAQLHGSMEQYPGASRILADRTKSENEWGKQSIGVYDELLASPTVACFNDQERAWIRSIDAYALSYIDTHFRDPSTLSQAILHGDLSFEHLRLLPDNQIYLFDFGDMCWGPVAHELGQFLRGFRDASISFARWAELRRWLLEGYTTQRSLTTADIAAIDLFIINRIVGQARYIIELSGDEMSAHGAEVIKHTYRLAEAMLAGRHIAPVEH